MKEIALGLFITTYLLLLIFPKIRAFIALASAAIFVTLGILPAGQIFVAIDWNVILMIAGTMGIVALFIDSKMPALMADVLIDRMPSVKWATIALVLFAGIISAFIDNVATVLMVAPVALNIAKKLNSSPVPLIISISLTSNLQGAATLVGDTTSVLLGGHANMNFIDFIFFHGKPGIFWAVQAGMAASTLVLLYIFRKNNTPIHLEEKETVEDFFPTVLLFGMVLLLILASFIPGKPNITNGVICTGLFLLGIIHNMLKNKDASAFKKKLREIDYFTILLLVGLFVVIGGIVEVGIVSDLSNIFNRIAGNNLFLIYTIIVWISVLFSAFIDNIPYVATMLPVVAAISQEMGIEPYLLYFGLLSGATLGGNITPIGASANIAALGILRKNGHTVSTLEFVKYGLPYTLTAVTVGYIFLWIVWR
ncbi:MAG TPA: SLC13 family permease [Atribacteraceae bacterium]|nr:SLC13 family permease [Atribacteraceae bacterium]